MLNHKTSHLQSLIMLSAAAVLLWSCESEYTVTATGSSRDRTDSLVSGGITRTFHVHLPHGYEDAPSPLVILLHQAGSSGLGIKYLTAFDLEADDYEFMVAYPDATTDWAYGCGCTEADSNGVDDVQLLTDLLNELDADYGIDFDSVFVAGFAEGAFMAQKAVCDAAASFAGLATVAATMPLPLAQSCSPAGPVQVLMIQGTEDE